MSFLSNQLDTTKKRETCYLPVPPLEAFALPNLIEPTTRSPRRIYTS